MFFCKLQTQHDGNKINKILGRYFPFGYASCKELRMQVADENLFPADNYLFALSDKKEYVAVIGYGWNLQENIVEVVLLEVRQRYHGHEYGKMMFSKLQERYPLSKIRVIAANDSVMNEYYLQRNFKIVDKNNFILEYVGGSLC